jgi:hypothetical protein
VPSYQVCGRTWCKHVAPSTHLFHNTTEGQTRLHCRSTHSRLSQAAIRSSGMWCQEMLSSILHGCHFDNISSFSLKKLSRIFLIRPRTVPPSDEGDSAVFLTSWCRRFIQPASSASVITHHPLSPSSGGGNSLRLYRPTHGHIKCDNMMELLLVDCIMWPFAFIVGYTIR